MTDKREDLWPKGEALKKKLLYKTVQELDDLKRLVAILDEVEGLVVDLTFESIIKAAPRVTALTAEADRLIKRHRLQHELEVFEQRFNTVFAAFTEIYHVEQRMKLDVNRMLRLELRKQQRRHQEEALAKTQVVLCAKCGKKPRRINEYCKRCARDEGIIVKGKIV